VDTSSGKSYERQVMRYLAERDQNIAFELDATIKDTSGVYFRQIDVWLPKTREVIECKHHSRPVTIGVIDTLIGTINDIGANGGRVFSHKGFTSNALARASKAGIECITLRFKEQYDILVEPTGGGYYSGDYVALCLCMNSTSGCDGYGRISYCDEDGDEGPICVGYSVDWGNSKLHGFVAYVILSHYLGKPPTDGAVNGFVAEYGSRFVAGQDWEIGEDEVWSFST
jgi:hypothetical protein